MINDTLSLRSKLNLIYLNEESEQKSPEKDSSLEISSSTHEHEE
jgi:hypothetical protein